MFFTEVSNCLPEICKTNPTVDVKITTARIVIVNTCVLYLFTKLSLA